MEKRAFEMRLEGLAAVQRARAMSQPEDDELQRGSAVGGGGVMGRRSHVQSGSKVAYSDLDPPSLYVPCLPSFPRLHQPLRCVGGSATREAYYPGEGSQLNSSDVTDQ